VEDDVNDRGLGPLRGLDESALHGFEVGDGVEVTVEQLEKQVSSQGVQSSSPPFGRPIIYRTSPATHHASLFRRRKIFAACKN
jgi:hypothetical protein